MRIASRTGRGGRRGARGARVSAGTGPAAGDRCGTSSQKNKGNKLNRSVVIVNELCNGIWRWVKGGMPNLYSMCAKRHVCGVMIHPHRTCTPSMYTSARDQTLFHEHRRTVLVTTRETELALLHRVKPQESFSGTQHNFLIPSVQT